MKNIFDRIERKLIVKNTFFVKKGIPRVPKENVDLDLKFQGDDALTKMRASRKEIFKDFGRDTSVLIKISINSHRPYPASTSLKMLESLIYCLIDTGVRDICIGDSSGLMHLPTRKVLREKGFDYLKKHSCRISVFDYGGWVSIPVDGVYFKNIILTEYIYKYDRIINLSNCKSHRDAGFTAPTKSMVGFMHPGQRRVLHGDHLKERIAEISLAVKPDINIVDARKIFIDGGPDRGRIAESNTIFINNDLLDADLKSYRLLSRMKMENAIYDLDEDPYSNDFFRHYIKIRGITE